MANETEIVEVRLPLLPKGYRYTGEYRHATEGEYIHLAQGMIVWEKSYDTVELYHIIEKIKWVPSIGESFFIITDTCDVRELFFRQDLQGEVIKLVNAGNYFKTYELAKETADIQKTFLTGRIHE